jgi:endoglucanase
MATAGYPAPYRNPDGSYDWGSNGLVANNAVVLALANDFTGDAKYREGVYETMGYLLGRNPTGYSYVTGYGDQPVRNVHHRFWANQLEPSLPIAPPGVLSGGPNSALQDPIAARLLQGCKPQKCFVDHIEAYSLNEVTVNWNSALAWVANWAAEKSEGKAGCEVDYSSSKWGSGQVATVKVTNTGEKAWDGWTLGFDFPASQKITNGWSATWTQDGASVTAASLPWNTKIAPGKSTYLGFVATSGATDADPTTFRIDGKACSTG